MPSMNRPLPALYALLVGAFVLVTASGCAGGNPFIGQAQDQLEQGNYDDALARTDSALAQPTVEPAQRAEIQMLRAQIYEQYANDSLAIDGPQQHAELIAQAIEAQDQALEADPSMRSDIQNRRSLTYIQEMQQGASAFNRARSQQNQAAFEAAAAYFDAASVVAPDSSAAHLNEAYALINAGDQAGAIPPLEQYTETEDSIGADQYTLLGQLYLTNDRIEEAIPVLEEGAEMYPENSDIQSLLLNAYNSAGMQERAIEAYRAQVERNPDNATYRYNLGSLLLNLERYEEALEQLRQAVELDPQNANTQYNLGAAYLNKAVDVNERISVLEDSLRNNQESLSETEAEQINQQAQELAQERRELFEQSIPPMERARQLAQAANSDQNVQRICAALQTAYVQTEQMEKAQEMQECSSGGGGN